MEKCLLVSIWVDLYHMLMKVAQRPTMCRTCQFPSEHLSMPFLASNDELSPPCQEVC